MGNLNKKFFTNQNHLSSFSHIGESIATSFSKMANSNQDFPADSQVPGSEMPWTEQNAILRGPNGKAQCQICGREFSILTSGKRHYRNLHMETIPFKCICCDQMVKNDAAHVLHLKKIHDVHVTKKQIDAARKIEMDGGDFLLEISEKMVICITIAGCNAKFTHIASAKRHYKNLGVNHKGKKSDDEHEQ